MGFEKYQVSAQNPQGLPLVLPKDVFSRREWIKIHISSPGGPYSGSIRHFGVVHNFLGFENYRVSATNPKELAFDFTKKLLFTTKTGWKSVFQLHESNILPWLDVFVLYINF
jgi:hypothetical protein